MAPSLATLRITDGLEGRAEASVVRSQAFRLQPKETQFLSDAVAGIYHICFLHAFIIMIMIICLCVRRYVWYS